MSEVIRPYLRLNQTQIFDNEVVKIDWQKRAPIGGVGIDTSNQDVIFREAKSDNNVLLSRSFLEITVNYRTESVAGTAADTADVTFENDL